MFTKNENEFFGKSNVWRRSNDAIKIFKTAAVDIHSTNILKVTDSSSAAEL